MNTKIRAAGLSYSSFQLRYPGIESQAVQKDTSQEDDFNFLPPTTSEISKNLYTSCCKCWSSFMAISGKCFCCWDSLSQLPFGLRSCDVIVHPNTWHHIYVSWIFESSWIFEYSWMGMLGRGQLLHAPNLTSVWSKESVCTCRAAKRDHDKSLSTMPSNHQKNEKQESHTLQYVVYFPNLGAKSKFPHLQTPGISWNIRNPPPGRNSPSTPTVADQLHLAAWSPWRDFWRLWQSRPCNGRELE